MFEDSTFESTGRIKTRSRRWMFAALVFNGTILLTLILVPLIYPDALPTHFIPSLLVAPAAPQPETPPPTPRVRAAQHEVPEFDSGRITAPPSIPTSIRYLREREGPLPPGNIASLEIGNGVPGADGKNIFGRQNSIALVHPPAPSSVRLPSRIVEGYLVYKNIPQYPVIPKNMGIEGTVVLEATISKVGSIENLRVVSGPPMLRQAAIDAVKTWRYRPYLLNQQPVEVETTVSVIFKLGH